MRTRIMDHHLSVNVPVFVRAKQIIDWENSYSVEEIVKTIDDLTEYVKEINDIKQDIIEATYPDIVSSLIEPINELFEEEFEERIS
jgi:hypothetical protein